MERIRITIEFKRNIPAQMAVYEKIKTKKMKSEELIELISAGMQGQNQNNSDIRKELQEIRAMLAKGVTIQNTDITKDKDSMANEDSEENLEIDFDFDNF